MFAGRSSVRLLLLLNLFGLLGVLSGAKPKRVWVVGFERVGHVCRSVGGLAEPGQLTFPYATLKDCVENKTADNHDTTAKRWEGYVLEADQCLKVWGRAKRNPFVMTKKAECEEEKKIMQAALAVVHEGNSSSRTKRDFDAGEGLAPVKMTVEVAISAVTAVFPAAAILLPLVNTLWRVNDVPVWDQVKALVKKEIHQKLNEAYAKEMRLFIKSLKKEIDHYKGIPEQSSQKQQRLVAIDVTLAVREDKFMDRDDPISTLGYYVPFVQTRIFVKLELFRIAPLKEKQEHLKQFMKLLRRYTIFAAYMAYYELERWRRSTIGYEFKYEHRRHRQYPNMLRYQYRFYDNVIGSSKLLWVKRKQHARWHSTYYENGVIKKMKINLINKLRGNIRAWGTLWNAYSKHVLVRGMDLVNSSLTIEGKPCMHYGDVLVDPDTCTKRDDGTSWCYRRGGGRADCFTAPKLDIDLTACLFYVDFSKQSYFDSSHPVWSEQYFGLTNIGTEGKKEEPCSPWWWQVKYKDFPFNGQKIRQASNYCRRFLKSDKRPWCYTDSGWKYCAIRHCTPSDWY